MAINQRPTKSQRPTQEQTKQELQRVRADEARRLNVPVEPDLYKAMKRRAVEEDRSISEITRELWREYLKEQA